jgi:hypothetical protein
MLAQVGEEFPDVIIDLGSQLERQVFAHEIAFVADGRCFAVGDFFEKDAFVAAGAGLPGTEEFGYDGRRVGPFWLGVGNRDPKFVRRHSFSDVVDRLAPRALLVFFDERKIGELEVQAGATRQSLDHLRKPDHECQIQRPSPLSMVLFLSHDLPPVCTAGKILL